jgi:hypothetical protein
MAAAYLWTLFLGMLVMVSGTMGAALRKPVDVAFGRNYVPTWAFDHIKYFNGGNEIQLHLDKYTGVCVFYFSLYRPLAYFANNNGFDMAKVLVFNQKVHTYLAILVCK